MAGMSWATFYLPILAVFCAQKIQGSRKKGMSGADASLFCDDFKVLNNMSWWYDWNLNHDQLTRRCTNRFIPEYVPMIWSYHHGRNMDVPAHAAFILGFNEPDHKDQANMTPQQAAAAWPELEKHSNGRPLVSPAPASHNFHWLDEFFQHCKTCRVDFVAAHAYSCNADEVMSYLHSMNQKYRKKIWLTEFACPHTTDMNQQLHLMKTLLPKLEAAEYVFRYSWFTTRVRHVFAGGFITPSASLFHNETSTLTRLGHFYNNFQGHNGGVNLVG